MKRFIALLLMLALMLSATGCVAVGFSSYGGRGGGHGNRGGEEIQGSGLMSELTFSTDKLSSLTIKIPAELYYAVGEIDGRIELHANLMEYVSISEDDGNVVIESDRNISVRNERDVPKIYVSAPSLERLDIDGAVTIKEMDTIASDTFKLDIDGVCNGTIDLAVKHLSVDIGGVSDLALTGTADIAVIEMAGVGSLKAFGLQTKIADVETSGVGGVEISCSEKLAAEVSGVGGIEYKGDPAVEPNVRGVGGLKKVG